MHPTPPAAGALLAGLAPAVPASRSVSFASAGRRTVRLKARAFQVRALKKGARLHVTLNAGGLMSPALAQDTTRVR